MKAGRFIVPAAAAALIVAIARPEIAHLLFQALVAATVVLLLIDVTLHLVSSLPASPWAEGWRPHRRARAALPAEIGAMAYDLRLRTKHLPWRTVLTLCTLFEQRLRAHHGLRAMEAADLPAIEQVLSPHAYYLVSRRHLKWTGGRHPLERIPRSWLGPLLDELERT